MDLKGGYLIIDISSLALAETEEPTAIEDEGILKQLLSLSDIALYSDKKLKPIYLRTKDSNGVECVVLCELDRNEGALRIKGEVLYHSLEIFITYDVDIDTQEVSIDSASYQYVAVSGGTKLYQHYLEIDTDDEEHIEVSIISWSPEVMVVDTNFELLTGYNCLSISKDLGGLGNWSALPYSLKVDESVLMIDDGTTFTSGLITDFSDEVTPL